LCGVAKKGRKKTQMTGMNNLSIRATSFPRIPSKSMVYDCGQHCASALYLISATHWNRGSSALAHPAKGPLHHLALVLGTSDGDFFQDRRSPASSSNLIQLDKIRQELGAIVHCLISTHATAQLSKVSAKQHPFYFFQC
jgi:hypothetical protein